MKRIDGVLILAPWLLLAVVSAGCEQTELSGRSAQDLGVGEIQAGDSGFHAEMTFCRKVGKKTGKRIGRGQQFVMGEKSAVHSFVDFSGVETGRRYAVHVVWIKPGGKEMFRKYCEVVVQPAAAGYQAVIEWRKAEDFSYRKQQTQDAAEPSFSIASRLNTSLAKARDPGFYLCRVYLERELFLERSFELVAP